MKKVYKTYTELAAAFKSGELDPAKYYLMLDKGARENSLSRHYDDSLSEEENERLMDEASAMWPNDPEIEELFKIAGIPCEWC